MLAGALLAACSVTGTATSGTPPPAVGSEGGACSPGGTCDGALTCDATSTCVAPASDPCGGVLCSGHGACVAVSGSPTCQCQQGYSSLGLACVADACATVTCTGHSACAGGACVCEAGWAAPTCTSCATGYQADAGSCVAAASAAMAQPYFYLGWGSPPSPTVVMTATGIRQFTLAFVLSSGGCSPAWDGSRALTGGVDEQTISAIRAAGGDVVPSIGGWSGNKLGPNCATAAALAAAYQQVIDAYALKAIDVDIENTDEFENATVQDRILGALKIVKANNPGLKTIVTFGTTTSGPTAWGTRLIAQAQALGADIDVFTIMPFDFGGGADMYGSTVTAADGLRAALESTYGWSSATAYAHLGISGMNGLSDVGETTTPAIWTSIRDWANAHHLARLAFWSVNRDRPCPGGALSESCSGIAQADWEFTRITAGFAP